MKVFICWSGTRGRQFAEKSRKWLTSVFGARIQASISVDFAKGAIWFEDLNNELQGARAGLICLTPEAVESPWIHYEAGVLSKTLHESLPTPSGQERSVQLRIFPFLHEVDPGTLKGPLSAYQSTSATDKHDVQRLVETLFSVFEEEQRANDPEALVDPSRKREWHERCDQKWNSFQADLKTIRPCPLTEIIPKFTEQFDRKTFNESMSECLTQEWLLRYDAAREIWAALKSQRDTVRKACPPHVADLFGALITELDAYAMCLSVLIGQPDQPIKPSGTLDFADPGAAEACEQHRKRIKYLVARLADSQHPPFFEESSKFEAAGTFSEKSRVLQWRTAGIRDEPFTRLMRQQRPKGSPPNKDKCRDSDWDLDRIVYYAWQHDAWDQLSMDVQLRCARLELDRAIAGEGDRTLLALRYALQTLYRAAAKSGDPIHDPTLRSLTTRTRTLITGRTGEAIADIEHTLSEIEATLVTSSPAVGGRPSVPRVPAPIGVEGS